MLKLAHGLQKCVYTGIDSTECFLNHVNVEIRMSRVKLLLNIREKDVVDELETLEGGGWHTLIDGGSTRIRLRSQSTMDSI